MVPLRAMAQRVGFVGLGVMGGPMAGHLVRAGHSVLVWNRTPGKAEGTGAEIAPTLAVLASECELIFTCVSRTEDVKACVAEMAAHAKTGTLFVDHSTIAPEGAEQIAASLTESGMRFVDAPITGGSVGAQKGQLTVFCGGSTTDVEEAIPYINAYAKRAERVGNVGSGQMTKLANQIAVGGALIGLCEALAFAKKANLDIALTRELIAGGAGGSWAFDNYGPKILNHDWTPGFSVRNQRKDFGYCAEAARTLDAAIPATLLIDRLLAKLEESGHGDWTTVALYETLLEMTAE